MDHDDCRSKLEWAEDETHLVNHDPAMMHNIAAVVWQEIGLPSAAKIEEEYERFNSVSPTADAFLMTVRAIIRAGLAHHGFHEQPEQ